jgi:hypothetical protein
MAEESRKNGLTYLLLSIAATTIIALVGWWGISMQLQVASIKEDQSLLLNMINGMNERLIRFEERQLQVMNRLGELETPRKE